MKISIIMAVHNEEKIIKKPLENFKKIHQIDKTTEFLIGLDGCTDKTKKIIRNYKFIEYYNFKGRNGKPKVIDKLIQKAKGDIIIIHDADWIFNVENKTRWVELNNEFKDKKLGGIAESYPLEYNKIKETKSIGHLGSLWGNYFWMDFQKDKYTYKKNNKTYAKFSKSTFPFLVNIFRKELYIKNITLGDDFERSLDILKKGYKILIKNEIDFPRMIAAYEITNIKDIARQKERTNLARSQVFKKYNLKINLLNFYLPLLFYSIKNLNKIKNLRGKIAFFSWMFIFSFGTIKNMISKEKSTKEGWLMRAKR
jgi:hypothetical protein